MLSPKQIRRYQAEAVAGAETLQGFSYGDMPAEMFPFTVYAEDSTTREILWQATVAGPGTMRVPALAHLCSPGAMVRVRTVYATGQVNVYPPYAEPET